MTENRSYSILYFGLWGYGRAGLSSLLKMQNIQIKSVFSKWDYEKQNIYLNQVHQLAISNQLNIRNSERENMRKVDFEKEILDFAPFDFIISCCFDRIFPEYIIKLPKIASLNIHPSLLPKYRGVKPLENAIINRETETGITLHFLNKELDAGKIILQKSIKIRPTNTFGFIYNHQCSIIDEIITKFFKSPSKYLQHSIPQDESLVSYAPRLEMNFNDTDTVEQLISSFENITR